MKYTQNTLFAVVGITLAFSLIMFVLGCRSRLPTTATATYMLHCRPIIKNYPRRIWIGPMTNDLETVGTYDELILDDGKNHFEVIRWRDDNDPYPVNLDTNKVYLFKVIRCPDWDSTFFGDKGSTRPAGFLDEIFFDGQSIWRKRKGVTF